MFLPLELYDEFTRAWVADDVRLSTDSEDHRVAVVSFRYIKKQSTEAMLFLISFFGYNFAFLKLQ